MHAITRLRQDIRSSRRRTSEAIAKCRKSVLPIGGNSAKKANGGILDQTQARLQRKAVKGTTMTRGCGAVMNGDVKEQRGR